jgi:hypothetical protein
MIAGGPGLPSRNRHRRSAAPGPSGIVTDIRNRFDEEDVL